MRHTVTRYFHRLPKASLAFLITIVFMFCILMSGCGSQAPYQETATDRVPDRSPNLRPGQQQAGQHPDQHFEERPDFIVDPEIIVTHNQLGYLLFADLVKEAVSKGSPPQGPSPEPPEVGASSNTNVIISPLSITLALTLAENGASGETAAAMARAMLRTPSLDRLNASNLALIKSLEQTSTAGDVRLNMANAVWYRAGLPLVPDFATTSKGYYHADIIGLDFENPESADRINAWANEATEGLVPHVVNELPADLAALITNAVYFQGDWQTPFDPNLTRPLPFHLASGGQAEVETMYRSGTMDYFEADFQAIRLPYGESGRVAMYVYLPPEKESITSFAARFQRVSEQALGNFRAYEGELWLPRLDTDFKSSLREPLKSLGMEIAFNPGAADFSRMIAGARPGDFFMSDVLHQAVLKVDETGTEAAAVTSVEVQLTSIPVRHFSLKVDRPFLITIRDEKTGTLLFTGAILDPKN